MKRVFLLFLITTIIFGLLVADYEQKIFSNATIDDEFHGSNVLVVLDKSISDFNKEQDMNLFGNFDKVTVQDIFPIYSEAVENAIIESIGEGEFRQIFLITLPNDDKQEVLNAIAKLEKIEGIRYAAPNYFLQLDIEPNDDEYRSGSLWGLDSINAPQAWNITTGSRNVRVGIIDTGIASEHPDLMNNWDSGWYFDGFGVDPIPDNDDYHGHGTHVAGIIGADGDNEIGVVGVNWDISLVALRFNYHPTWYDPLVSSCVDAINYATNAWDSDEKLSILNYCVNSYGWEGVIATAASYFPGLFVCSAGNAGADVDNTTYYPFIEQFSLGNLISVGSIDSFDNRAGTSNFSLSGNNVSIYAPGVNIMSTCNFYSYPYTGYYPESGTSMAAPFVTGVAALLLSINPTLTAQQLKNIILDNSNDISITLPDNSTQVVKKLDAYKAITNQAKIISHRTELDSFYPFTLGIEFYNWVCFPVLNKFNQIQPQFFDDMSDYFYTDDIYYNLQISNDNYLFGNPPTSSALPIMKWHYNTDIDSVTTSNIDIVDHRLDSRYGYKIKLEYPRRSSIILDGFLAGRMGNINTRITLKAKPPREPFRETWVGYFRKVSLEPLNALRDVVQDLIEIKTQYWALNRASTIDPWPPIASQRRLNYGEAVSLKYVGITDSTFIWPGIQYRSPFEDEYNRYTHPMPIYFSFEEKEDYIPIYVDFNEYMFGDKRGELALYIDDICYGAEVVTGEDVVQINAYIKDTCIDTANIELRFYEYEPTQDSTRDITSSEICTYKVKNIQADPNKTFYTISFKDGEVNTATTEVKTALDGNYPNPFNPSTSIKFTLAQSGNVKLQVFNVKGQLVKTLVNTIKEVGSHTIIWNGTDDQNKPVTSGIYFYRLEANSTTAVKRMLLIK